MLARLKRVLTAWWFWGLLGTVALCVLVWFATPLMAFGEVRPMEPAAPRLAVIATVVAIWGAVNLTLRLRDRRANARMVEEMSYAEREQAAREETERGAAGEELAAIHLRAQEALALLRRARFGHGWRRRYVYQLPWYVLIGPPASGKTTAVLNAGLDFPLDQRLGQRGVIGLGGTRNTDWWLSEDAVLIDTAGRYTTQDSRPAVDAAAWQGFLGLLKRHRPRQPINGALVVMSPTELAAMDEGERLEHAAAIRRRLLELGAVLGVRFPIYVLFSKADLVLGFAEFFDGLGREERAQVWGATLPFDDGLDPDGAVAQFAVSFDALLTRLDQQVVRRLQEEPDGRRRARILDFPVQLAALKPVMGEFLDQVFRPSRYEGKLLLRGFYLTSGTQQGLPVDLLAEAMAPAFGLTAEALRPVVEPPASTSRALFLPRLFRDVVLAEASLVGLDQRRERRRRLSGWAAASVVTMACAALGLAWTGAFTDGRAWLAGASAQASRLDPATAAHDRARGNLTKLAASLDGLRALPVEPPQPAPHALYDGDAVAEAGTQAYTRGLQRMLLPTLLSMAEDGLRNQRLPQALTYETLKVYLMLGRQGPLDAKLIAAWVEHELASRLAENDGTRQRLALHTGALLAVLPDTVALESGLVTATRSRLSEMTLASRGYDMARELETARTLPVWRPSEHAGAAAAKVLVRPSGRTLWDGIPGIYTRTGFFEVFLPASARLAEELAKESWVIGPTDRPGISAIQRIREDMLSLYLDDYARAWDDVLADVVVTPFYNAAHAADTLNILSGPSSPLKKFLSSVAAETELDTPPPSLLKALAGDKGAGTALATAAANDSLAEQSLIQAGQAVTPGAQFARASALLTVRKGAPPPGHPVTERFKPVRDLVTASADGTPAGLDTVIKRMADMYKVFNKMARAPSAAAQVMANSDEMEVATGRTILQADTMPSPLDTMVGAVAESAAAVAQGGSRDYLDNTWRSSVLPACLATVDRRYPFDRTSGNDAPLADVSVLLGPGGHLDQFFNTHLKPFVDTTAHPWRWQSVEGVDLGLSNEVLSQFERAATLRKALFRADAKAPSLRFAIEPLKVDEAIDTLLLNIDGQELIYRHGPTSAMNVEWPAAAPSGVRLSFGPARDNPKSTLIAKGPYGLLRLLAAGKLVPEDTPDRYRLDFSLGERHVSFFVTASQVDNPLALLPELEKFRCPSW